MVSTSDDTLSLDVSHLLSRVHGRRQLTSNVSADGNASAHGSRFNTSMWRHAGPGDMLKFSPDADCGTAASLPRRYGGVLNSDARTTVVMTIPPLSYYLVR